MTYKQWAYSIVAAITIGLGACKKSDPPQHSTATQPVFTFSANINSAPVSLQAGVGMYYMYTSYTQDANNVYNFTGDLKVYNCSSCPNSVQIKIKDYQALAVGTPVNVNLSLVPGYYAYQASAGAPTQYNISFTSFFYNVTPQSWAWNFGDGTTSTVQNPAHTYDHPGNYTACLTTTFTDLTTGSICNPVYVGTPESGLSATFTYTATLNSVVFAPAVGGGSGSYSYAWDFGDGTTSTQQNPTHAYATPGVYLVRMLVTDGAGHYLAFNQNCRTQTYTGSVAGMYFVSGGSNTNPNGLSNVIINWTDAWGLVWTSDNAAQPSTSYFKVISVDPYDNNSSGQTTKKIHAQIKCTLYNGSNTLLLDNGDIIFGVAYH